MKKLAIAGSGGRMGEILLEILLPSYQVLAISSKSIEYFTKYKEVYNFNLINSKKLQLDDFVSVDCFIDFSNPALTMELLDIAENLQKPILIATTGFDSIQLNIIKQKSLSCPILLAPNTSVGINLIISLLINLIDGLTKLDVDYGIDILDIHHSKKLDSPSGTAIKLANVIYKAREQSLIDFNNYQDKDIQINSIRAGNTIGEHITTFHLVNEEIKINHKAHNRNLFAQGALCLVKKLKDKPNGLYYPMDLLR